MIKAIILAAGKGERLLPLTEDRPKICVDLGEGSTLLSRQTDSLFSHSSYDEIIVGAGHCIEKVEEFASGVQNRGPVTVVYNPFYGISGPLVTLWVVLNKIDDSGFLFMNGDTFYSDNVYSRIDNLLSTSGDGIFLVCSRTAEIDTDDVRVKLNERSKVREAAKNIADYDAVSAGLVIVLGEKSRTTFRRILDKVSRREDFLSFKKTWHSFIKDLADEGIDVDPLWVERSEWAEVDIQPDLQNVKKIL